MAADKIELSSNFTVARYRELEESDNRDALAQFVRDRFNERYFHPIRSTRKNDKHGFMIMAICCLVIETLESFYQGKGDTRGCSSKMFRDFFNRETALKVFAGDDDWFFNDIRCGILHQSETRKGWRIRRDGLLLDKSAKCINATDFFKKLHEAVDAYADQLNYDEKLWLNFKKKMDAVCKNCKNELLDYT